MMCPASGTGCHTHLTKQKTLHLVGCITCGAEQPEQPASRVVLNNLSSQHHMWCWTVGADCLAAQPCGGTPHPIPTVQKRETTTWNGKYQGRGTPNVPGRTLSRYQVRMRRIRESMTSMIMACMREKLSSTLAGCVKLDHWAPLPVTQSQQHQS